MKVLLNTFLLCLLLFLGIQCATTRSHDLVSINLVDHHGISETISEPSRLQKLGQIDFDKPQPYQKILRLYEDPTKQHTHYSVISSYHPNGQLWQKLECLQSRAFGNYEERYPNGQLKLKAYVIAGLADLTEEAKKTWLFDGVSVAYSEKGAVLAEVSYDKGMLHGKSLYYYPHGTVERQLYYLQGKLEGKQSVYYPYGQLKKEATFLADVCHGEVKEYRENGALRIQERYVHNQLESGIYWDIQGKKISEVIDFQGNKIEYSDKKGFFRYQIIQGEKGGYVQEYDDVAQLIREYYQKNGVKEGKEIEYYPSLDARTPKMELHWVEGIMHGSIKTWYPSGSIQSCKEMFDNNKNGMSYVWYPNGKLMMQERYEQDKLIDGSYFTLLSQEPVCQVHNGSGEVRIFDERGKLIQMIHYEEGIPCQ